MELTNLIAYDLMQIGLEKWPVSGLGHWPHLPLFFLKKMEYLIYFDH